MQHLRHKLRRFHFVKKRERLEIYAAITTRIIATGLIGIFIPIYLVKELNYPLLKFIIYCIIELISAMIAAPLIGKLSGKIGQKHTMLLSTPFTITFLALLYYAGQVPFYFIALIGGMAVEMYWIPYHVDFSKFSDKKGRGSEVSHWFSLAMVASVIGPLLGGILISSFGFNTVFVISSVLIVFSAIPPLFSKEIHEPVKIKVKKIFAKNHFRDMFGLMGYSFSTYASGIFWPLFMFMFLDSYVEVGLIIAFTAFVDIFFTLLAGKLTDKGYGGRILFIGTIINSVTHWVRGFLHSFTSFIWLTATYAIGFTLQDVPHNSLFYDKAAKNKKKMAEYVVFREMSLNAGRIFVVLILLCAMFAFKSFGLADMELIKTSFIATFVASGFLNYLILLY